MLKEYHIEIVSFVETKSTLVTALKFPFQFVSVDSAGNFQLYFCGLFVDRAQVYK